MDMIHKTALVTAGSKGIGEAVVEELASRGANIAFTYLKDERAADRLVSKLKAGDHKALAFQADSADHARAQEVVKATKDEFGRIDYLVHNAGISDGGAIWDLTEAQWDRVMEVTLKGAFNYISAASHDFMEQKNGKIVCIGSINGLRGRVGGANYNAAKAGLVGLIKTVAAEMGRFNVNANVVAPGFVESPSQQNTPELVRDVVLKEVAIKRLGTPGDIAPLVAFLCSDAARHITGQLIKVDAGQYL